MNALKNSKREVVSLGGRDLFEAAWEILIDRGYCAVEVNSCPIDGHVAVQHNDAWHLWRSFEPDLLVNALGCKDGLVDPAVAWVETMTALNADSTQLVVAFADLEGHSLSRPTNVDLISVEVAGELVDFDVDRPAADSEWEQLHSFLTVQLAHCVQRGERLNIGPIQWDHGERPMVRSCAEPGDYIDSGHGFYIDVWPETSDDDPVDDEPIAPYRRSSLTHVVDAICDVIKSWDISPLNVTTPTTPYLRGTFLIPE